MLGVEHSSADVVEVAPAGVDFPSARLAHAPNLDDTVVRRGENERQRGMEDSVIHATIVTFQHILDGRERVVGFKVSRAGAWLALSQSGDVPHSDGLIHGGRDDEVVLRVEVGGHHVVRVSSEDSYAVTRSAVPYPDGLIVGGGDLKESRSALSKGTARRVSHNPGHFVVELDRSYVVQMTKKGEQAAPVLRPYV